MGEGADKSWVGLAEAVAGVRAELAEAMIRGKDSDPKFEVGAIEMEFAVELRRENAVNGGVQVWVLQAGVSRSSAQAHTHRLTVTLTPTTADGGPVRITPGTGITVRPER